MNIKAVRVALVALGVALIAAVLLTLRRPAAPPTPPPRPPDRPATETRQSGLVYRIFKLGRERVTIEAETMVSREGEAMHLKGVNAKSLYIANGEEGTVTIRSDEGVYNESQERFAFKGHVKITTEDGFDIETDSLNYRGEHGIAKTDAPTRYKRGNVSGSSKGVEYAAESGRILMPAEVSFRIENEHGKPPALVRSEHAVAFRKRGMLRFHGDVAVDQGRDQLRSDELALSFDPQSQILRRATAQGGVSLKTSGASVVPGAPGGPGMGNSSRDLRSQRLVMNFRADRSLRQAVASGDADLRVLPGPGQRPERRRVQAQALTFDFDHAGRAVRAKGQKRCVMVSEPIGKPSEAGTVHADAFQAWLDPESGEATRIDFKKNVSFERKGAQATAGFARYTGDGTLHLEKQPKIREVGGDLTARAIEVGTQTGNLDARGDVRHLLRREPGAGRTGLLSGEDAPTLVTCQVFLYESASHAAHYQDGALLRSGRDEVRAPKLLVEQDAQGSRRLTGTEGVVSLLHPKPRQPGGPEGAPIEGRGQRMVYDEGAGRIQYNGDVSIRQGDIVTKSPRATITLSADGTGMQKLVAGEPLEVAQGSRKATGRRGVYTPENETMVMTGDPVTLIDGNRQSQGRSLTFKVGDDTILVDGEEEGRTETILKTEPAPQ